MRVIWFPALVVASFDDPVSLMMLSTSSPTSVTVELGLTPVCDPGVMSFMRSSLHGLALAPSASDPSVEDVVDDSGVLVRLLLEDIADGRDDNPNVMPELVGGAWDPSVIGGEGDTAGSEDEPGDLEDREPSRGGSVVSTGLTGIFG